MANNSLCSVEGCDKPVTHSGWCSMHISRMRRHGTLSKRHTSNGEPQAHFDLAILQETDDHIIWPFSKNKAGYGKISNNLVHRLACVQAHGPAPSELHEAAHKSICHTPACFNPRHLYWATPSENQRDRVQDGTSNRGGNYGNSKLQPEQVREIREAVSKHKQSHHQVAAKYKVSRTVVTRIVNGSRWGWLV